MHCRTLRTAAPQGAFKNPPCTQVSVTSDEVAHG